MQYQQHLTFHKVRERQTREVIDRRSRLRSTRLRDEMVLIHSLHLNNHPLVRHLDGIQEELILDSLITTQYNPTIQSRLLQ